MKSPIPARVVGVLPIVVALASSCCDAPTAPVRNCELASVGPTIAMTPPSVNALLPLIVDAQTRLVPSLGAAASGISAELDALERALLASNAVSRCESFNAVAGTLTTASTAVAPAALPDLEAVRLVLRLIHLRLVTG
jgi:hypothetical protein